MRMTVALLFLCLVVATGCGDGGTTTPTPTTTTTTAGPTSAAYTLTVIDALIIQSQASGNLFGVELRVQETAGVGGNMNFIRLDYLRATGDLEERAEIGASDIIRDLGTNRIAPSSSWQNVVIFFFRASIKKGRQLIVTVNITDDRGNTHNLTQTFTFT